jgi:hypothetical protein
MEILKGLTLGSNSKRSGKTSLVVVGASILGNMGTNMVTIQG